MSTAQAVAVEVCGKPRLRLDPNTGTAEYLVLLHTTDPDSEVHAEISVRMHPESGAFMFSGAWVL